MEYKIDDKIKCEYFTRRRKVEKTIAVNKG